MSLNTCPNLWQSGANTNEEAAARPAKPHNFKEQDHRFNIKPLFKYYIVYDIKSPSYIIENRCHVSNIQINSICSLYDATIQFFLSD